MTDIPFFTLTAEETHPLAVMCIGLTESMKAQGKISKQADLLKGEFLDAFKRLKEKLLTMKEETDENGDIVGQEIALDVQESFAMQYCIAIPFYGLKAHIDTPPEKRTGLTPEEWEETANIFYELKDEAAALLTRLTIAWNYFEFGLQTLEEVFGIKLAVRPLKVDDVNEVAVITRNEHNSHLFGFMFHLLDAMELYQDKYEFARRLYSCQFIHITDYNALKAKLLAENKSKEISLTLRDNITLYCTLSLTGIFFLSDGSGFYEEVAAEADANRPKPTPSQSVRDFFRKDREKAAKTYAAMGIKADPSGIVHTSANDLRDFFLKFSDQFRAEMRKNMRKLPFVNKIFTEHIECVKQWII
jgi:hypothetical protein